MAGREGNARRLLNQQMLRGSALPGADTGGSGEEKWAFKSAPSDCVTGRTPDATDTYLRANHGSHAIRQAISDADALSASGRALSLTWEHGDCILNIARDGKVNFSVEGQAGVSLGWRF